MTTMEIYNDFKSRLKEIYDDREAENIRDWVFEKVTGLKKWERRNLKGELNEDHLKQLEKYLLELLDYKPVQYVLNEAWFYKRKFYVNKRVLIPRPETEELVEWIVGNVRSGMYNVQNDGILNTNEQSAKHKMRNSKIKILDIGSGSGCIPVSLKKELPECKITSIDISAEALNVSKENANNLDAEVSFFQLDFLNEKEWNRLSSFDIIVSNPPYIPVLEKKFLNKNVIDFEPEVALFVADDNPFVFYEKIAKFAQTHLDKSGKIYVEVHEKYAKNIKTVFENAGFISAIKKDIYGKERMVSAVFT